MTRNHDYNTPPKGARNWHRPLNQNFQGLDTDVEIRDVESSLDEYAPKPGAKFLATDTENEYIGDGDRWQELASSGQNPSFASVQTNNLNDTVYTPTNNTIAAIDNALQNHQYVRLKPGQVYSGPSKLEIKPSDGNGNATNRILEAYGAGIDYKGRGNVAVDILPNYNIDGGYGGRVKILGGHFSGPGKYNRKDAAIRATDHFGVTIHPDNALNATHGILVRNVNNWSESPYIETVNTSEPPTALDYSEPTYYTRFQGADSTGGSGTNSFRTPRVRLEWAPVQEGGKTFWQDKAEMHGGDLTIKGFAPEDGYVFHSDGWGRGLVVRLECEGGNQNSTAVRLDGDVLPVFLNPHIDSTSGMKEYEKNGYGNALIINEDGISEATSNGSRMRLAFSYDSKTIKFHDELDLNGRKLTALQKVSDDANASNDSLYFDTTDKQLEYKDPSGTIHPLG